MNQYAARWQENEGNQGWVFDEKAMELELFQHRFGERPSLGMVVESIPVLNVESIPEDQAINVSASETEAILVENEKDRLVLKDLLNIAPSFGQAKCNGQAVNGDIRSTWDSDTRKGVSTGLRILYCSVYVRRCRATLVSHPPFLSKDVHRSSVSEYSQNVVEQ
jgi:hypothetical protein